MWKVKTEKLLLIAAIVWGAAGVNIAAIGLCAYAPYWSALNVALSAAVYALFTAFVFLRLTRKHTQRITGYTDSSQYFWKFFDLKSFIIMAAMITLGVSLRSSPAVPQVFIAVFYTGLGFSLITAGIVFAVNYARAVRRK